ncbi:MAG: threonine synthase [Chloroherpetonaceae bacterium]|nr:threonine synthase [Chloroherpetonaceae bacterium]MDW8437332.1 threonine synthase [Chloroherpetonaceae bacterium]
MRLCSTNNPNHVVSLREAVLQGLASDGGLFVPTKIPTLPPDFFRLSRIRSFHEIAFQAAQALFQGAILNADLKAIIEEAFDFDAPLVRLDATTHVLELFHGETLAFKDFGARFLARLMKHYLNDEKRETLILVATSGDTGSAVGRGFFGMEGFHVCLLYPSGKVSQIQEQQLTTIGGNVVALEIQGAFDDCQRLVKQAFLDAELRQRYQLSSANSINVARLIPQMFYYFRAYSQLHHSLLSKPLVFSVPSGNFGNLTAGLLAKKMGLPVSKFVAATNRNDVVPKYLESGRFEPKPSIQTLSNAMDVGNPSNFARMLWLYGSVEKMREDVFGASFSDAETLDGMRDVYRRYEYLAEPHAAIGYLGLERYRSETGSQCAGIVLATAHPAKFLDAFEQAGLRKPPIPERLEQTMRKPKRSVPLPNDFGALKEFLMSMRNGRSRHR